MGFIRLIYYGQPFSQYFDLCGCHYVDRIIKRKKYIDDKCQTVIPDAECVKTEIETLSRSIEDQSFKFHALAENLCQVANSHFFSFHRCVLEWHLYVLYAYHLYLNWDQFLWSEFVLKRIATVKKLRLIFPVIRYVVLEIERSWKWSIC